MVYQTLARTFQWSNVMSLIILIIVLIVVFGGAGYGFRGTYANGPYIGGGLGLILLLVLIWLLLGRGSIVL